MLKFNTDHLDQWRIKEIEEGGYYILSAHRTPYKSRLSTETVRYWTVTITLTSGDVEEFYIKARNRQEAQEKAESLKYLADMKLNNKGYRLIP